MVKIPSVEFPTPSIYTRNSVLILRDDSASPSVLLPQSESTSSIKIRAGFFSLAISNKFLTSFSDSPYHLLTKSEDEIEKKVLSHSLAQAFARKDLPVPGGPQSRIPFHGFLAPWNNYGNLIGRMMASFKLSLAPSSPATSSHLMFGFSETMALINPSCNFLDSSSSSPPFYFFLGPASAAAPPPLPSGGAVGAI